MQGFQGPERRKAERLPLRCEVSYRLLREGQAEPKRVAARTLNLSASGLCLVSPEPLKRESLLALELDLEGRSDPVVAVGRVVWCDTEKAEHQVGICFTWLREDDRKALAVIAEYVQERLQS